jgi:hypothetical protein
MPLTTTSPHQFKQYHPSSNIAVTHPYRIYQYLSLNSVLTYRQPKPDLSHNPLHRVLQSESTSTPQKVRAMPQKQQGSDSPIPAAASRWKKETLDLLNAKYDRHHITPFKFEGLIIPDELQKGMTRPINSAKYSH